MEMHVLVERTAENGYRAVTGPPFQIAVEGGTREEASRRFGRPLRREDPRCAEAFAWRCRPVTANG
jgi:hypothetical protein